MQDTISIAELESRMQPNAWSIGGFLGSSESLESVIHEDAQTLDRLGVSYDILASTLQDLLSKASKGGGRGHLQFSARSPENLPRFSLNNLPIQNAGFTQDAVQVFITGFMGKQDCPWECENPELSSIDFLCLNRLTGEWMVGPGMIVHLIRNHHFFEGHGSPYRVDPEKLIRILRLELVK